MSIRLQPALGRAPPRCPGPLIPSQDGPPQQQRLKQRGQPLLAIQDQPLSVLCSGRRGAFDGSLLEPQGVAARAKQHHGADWIRQGDAGQQRSDVGVVPDPASLEVGQLGLAMLGFMQELG